jgi:hypothetical protein
MTLGTDSTLAILKARQGCPQPVPACCQQACMAGHHARYSMTLLRMCVHSTGTCISLGDEELPRLLSSPESKTRRPAARLQSPLPCRRQSRGCERPAAKQLRCMGPPHHIVPTAALHCCCRGMLTECSYTLHHHSSALHCQENTWPDTRPSARLEWKKRFRPLSRRMRASAVIADASAGVSASYLIGASSS